MMIMMIVVIGKEELWFTSFYKFRKTFQNVDESYIFSTLKNRFKFSKLFFIIIIFSFSKNNIIIFVVVLIVSL